MCSLSITVRLMYLSRLEAYRFLGDPFIASDLISGGKDPWGECTVCIVSSLSLVLLDLEKVYFSNFQEVILFSIY